jgi:hypothetical protein
MPDADRLSVRDHTAIYEAVAARDPMRAFHEMTGHLRLISELYRESKRLSDEILHQVAHDVAGWMNGIASRCGPRQSRRRAMPRDRARPRRAEL